MKVYVITMDINTSDEYGVLNTNYRFLSSVCATMDEAIKRILRKSCHKTFVEEAIKLGLDDYYVEGADWAREVYDSWSEHATVDGVIRYLVARESYHPDYNFETIETVYYFIEIHEI